MNRPQTSTSGQNPAEPPSISAVVVAAVVRAAVAGDAAALAVVAAETFPLACPPTTTREATDAFIAEYLTEASFASYLADPARMLFVAERGGELAGYTMVIMEDPKDADVAGVITTRPVADLSKVYVRESFHGGGIAQALVEASVDAARQRGAATIWLGVNRANARANRFYEKSGFEIVGIRRFAIGGGFEDDFVRERRIPILEQGVLPR